MTQASNYTPYTPDALSLIRASMASGVPARRIMHTLGWGESMFNNVCMRHGIAARCEPHDGHAILETPPARVPLARSFNNDHTAFDGPPPREPAPAGASAKPTPGKRSGRIYHHFSISAEACSYVWRSRPLLAQKSFSMALGELLAQQVEAGALDDLLILDRGEFYRNVSINASLDAKTDAFIEAEAKKLRVGATTVMASLIERRCRQMDPLATKRDWLICHSAPFERGMVVHNRPSAADAYELRRPNPGGLLYEPRVRPLQQ